MTGTAGSAAVPLPGTRTYVVDAFALLFQIFHAMPEMTSPQGQSVGCVYGLLRDILFLIDEKSPDYLLVAFDLPGGTFRHALYDQYKADRGEMPESLVEQIPNVKRMLAALQVPIVALESFEADDVMASVARRVEQAGGECLLVTNDKDCRQLISDHVQVFSIRKNEVYDRNSLAQEWGIRPDQVIDFQSLVGDPVDHVPGVPLVGPKIAGDLLRQFDTLEGIYANIDTVAGPRRRQNLIDHRDQAFRNRQLVQLRTDLPLAIDWQAARPGQFAATDVAALCREFGFRTYLRRFADQEATPTIRSDQAASCIQTLTDWDRELAGLAGAATIAILAAGDDLRPRWGNLLGCAWVWGDERVVYLSAEMARETLDRPLPDATRTLRQVLEDPAVAKVGHDLKGTARLWRSLGVRLHGYAFDTMLAGYLLDAGSRNYGIEELALRYRQQDLPLTAQLRKASRKTSALTSSELAGTTSEKAIASWRLAEALTPELAKSGLDRVLHDLELPLLPVLLEMELTGIRIDVRRLETLSGQFRAVMDDLAQRIFSLAGTTFNLNAPKQLAQVLFDRLQLPILKKTKTGPSTDAEVLEQLATMHELPALIIQYRQYSKLQSTYVDALPAMVHPDTGRVHTTFHQVVAATGRLSSADPNLQNIPIRSEAGNEIRSAFVPGEPGWQLLSADYSQIELRVLAHFSGDAALCRAFQDDMDIHAHVASEIFGVPIDQVTATMRRTAKAVNFGVIYGQSAFGLAKALGIEQDQAMAFIEAYFGRYAGMTQFMDNLLEACWRDGFVQTIAGRRRTIQGVREGARRDWRQRNLPERTAINTVIQGSAADLVKWAMIRIDQRMQQERWAARMLLQIHDELLFEVPAEELQATATLVREEMESVQSLKVPLQVDVQAGPNWAACEGLARS